MPNRILNILTELNPQICILLKSAISTQTTSPTSSVINCRKILEVIMQGDDGNGLSDKISTNSSGIPDIITTKMHYIRKIGNNGAHSATPTDIETAKQCISNTLSVIKWKYNINNQEINFRFFVANAVYKTWAKLAVLSSDGVLYSEYLYYLRPKTFSKSGLNFHSFKETDHRFGADEHGKAYQSMREISYEEACQFPLTSQTNWISSYVQRKIKTYDE